MLNLARYVQIHPSLRYLRTRHKSTILVVFVIFLIYFVVREVLEQREHGPSRASITRNFRDDEFIRLRAQNGYLKHKLAKLQPMPNANDKSVPTIYVITPTYKRPQQKAELTRLCHTFLLVPNIHWIVIEDAKVNSKVVEGLLTNCGVVYTLLHEETPPDHKLKDKDQHWSKPRGVHQRNAALHWLRDAFRGLPANQIEGVIYFADDDNTYSLELFEEMRTTQKVSVWPVGIVGGLMVEKPKLEAATGKVIGWDVSWSPQRPFAIDMAGFAINVKHFVGKTKAKFAYQVKRGHQESELLRHLVSSLDELEPKAELCTKVLVWHTRTEKVDLKLEDMRKKQGLELSDHLMEV